MLLHLAPVPARRASVGGDTATATATVSPDDEPLYKRVVTVGWFSLPGLLALAIFGGTLAIKPRTNA